VGIGGSILLISIDSILMAAFVLIMIILGIIAILKGPKILKVENNILTIKMKEEKEYYINNIQDIKFYRNHVGRLKTMFLYIKENETYNCYPIVNHKFDDVETFIYLVTFIKSNELEKIESLTNDEFKQLQKSLIYKKELK